MPMQPEPETCDYCHRPVAPEEYESSDQHPAPESVCWGPGDALCDDMHDQWICRQLEARDRLALTLRDIRSQAIRSIEWRRHPGGQHVGTDRWATVPMSLALALERDIRSALEAAGVPVEVPDAT